MIKKLEDEHSEMVHGLKKDPESLLNEMNETKLDAIHMSIGVAGEAGELLDAVKRFAIYGRDLDRENVVEELGDLEFYIEGLRQTFNISRQETLTANIAKLGKRYDKGRYTDEDAQARKDKAYVFEGEVASPLKVVRFEKGDPVYEVSPKNTISDLIRFAVEQAGGIEDVAYIVKNMEDKNSV